MKSGGRLEQKIKRLRGMLVGGAALCEWCLGRLFERDPLRARESGLRIAREHGVEVDNAKCMLCKGFFSHLAAYAKHAVKELSKVEFERLYVGVSVPKGLIDLEDEVRSKLRVAGGLPLKKTANKLLLSHISGELSFTPDYKAPDVVARFNLHGFAGLDVKPVVLFCRYVKHDPRLAFQAPRCSSCKGSGCPACNLTGLRDEPDSLEYRVVSILLDLFNARRVVISWTGTDDVGVSVLGRGRPFYAKVVSPRRRFSWVKKTMLVDDKVQLTLVEESSLKNIQRRERYYNKLLVTARVSGGLTNPEARRLEESLRDVEVRLTKPDGPARIKHVKYVNVLELGGNGSVKLEVLCEHGFDIRKLFSCKDVSLYSRETCNPSLKTIIGRPCLDLGYTVADVLTEEEVLSR